MPEPVLALSLYLGTTALVANKALFISLAQLAKKFTCRVGARPNARCFKQGGAQLWHCGVTFLLDDFGKEAPMQVQFAIPFRPTLRSNLRPACPPDRRRPSAPHPWLARASSVMPPRERLTLPQNTSETALEACLAKF